MAKNNTEIDLSIINEVIKNIDSYTFSQLIEIRDDINELLQYTNKVDYNFSPEVTTKLVALNQMIEEVGQKRQKEIEHAYPEELKQLTDIYNQLRQIEQQLTAYTPLLSMQINDYYNEAIDLANHFLLLRDEFLIIYLESQSPTIKSKFGTIALKKLKPRKKELNQFILDANGYLLTMGRNPYQTHKLTDDGTTSLQDELGIDIKKVPDPNFSNIEEGLEEVSTIELETEVEEILGLKFLELAFELDQVALGFELRTPKNKVLQKFGPQKKFKISIKEEHSTHESLLLIPVFNTGKEKRLEIEIPSDLRATSFFINIEIDYKFGDGEKELVILINGAAHDNLGSNLKYWNDDVLEELEDESGFDREDFVLLDGDGGGGVIDFLEGGRISENLSSESRAKKGKKVAYIEAKNILSKLKKEGGIDKNTGLINRKIIIVTHSRGGVFGEAFKEELLKIFKSGQYLHLFGSKDKVDELIDIVLNLDPHQSSMLNVKKGKHPTINVSHDNSFLGGDHAVGDCININTEQTSFLPHGNNTFSKEVPLIFDQHNENIIEGENKYNGYDGLLPNQDTFDSVEENLDDADSIINKGYRTLKGGFENKIEDGLEIYDGAIDVTSDAIGGAVEAPGKILDMGEEIMDEITNPNNYLNLLK